MNGDGGDGGDAVAGSAILDVNGANGVLTSDNSLTMRANGVAGAGAEGASIMRVFGPGGVIPNLLVRFAASEAFRTRAVEETP